MAKVVITLEDIKDADGNSGLAMDVDGIEGAEDGSYAAAYSSAFIQYILSNAQQAAILDKEGGSTPPDTSTLN